MNCASKLLTLITKKAYWPEDFFAHKFINDLGIPKQKTKKQSTVEIAYIETI